MHPENKLSAFLPFMFKSIISLIDAGTCNFLEFEYLHCKFEVGIRWHLMQTVWGSFIQGGLSVLMDGKIWDMPRHGDPVCHWSKWKTKNRLWKDKLPTFC